jgi:hypothetical protein
MCLQKDVTFISMNQMEDPKNGIYVGKNISINFVLRQWLNMLASQLVHVILIHYTPMSMGCHSLNYNNNM